MYPSLFVVSAVTDNAAYVVATYHELKVRKS